MKKFILMLLPRTGLVTENNNTNLNVFCQEKLEKFDGSTIFYFSEIFSGVLGVF